MLFINRLKIFAQYLIPQHALSRLLGYFSRCRCRIIKNNFIKLFMRTYKINLSDALKTNINDYSSFHDFFIRELKPDARPIADDINIMVSPVDGCISQFGKIKNDRLFQAKNFDFTLQELLGKESIETNHFKNGNFITLYLAPGDYHRVHMPMSGTLKKMIYIPGRLFSVNKTTTSSVPRLFARNERVVCFFETQRGPIAVILVGALIVGSIYTSWAGQITPQDSKRVEVTSYDTGIHDLKRGDELGYFAMGSTVIVLSNAENKIEWDKYVMVDNVIKMGQNLGHFSK